MTSNEDFSYHPYPTLETSPMTSLYFEPTWSMDPNYPNYQQLMYPVDMSNQMCSMMAPDLVDWNLNEVRVNTDEVWKDVWDPCHSGSEGTMNSQRTPGLVDFEGEDVSKEEGVAGDVEYEPLIKEEVPYKKDPSLPLTPAEADKILTTPIPGSPDTKSIAIALQKWLKTTETSQKTFADRIIGRSQGTLSTLLNSPRPWGMMYSGREVFVRIYNFLRISNEEKEEIMKLKLELRRMTSKPRSSNKKLTSVQKTALDKMFKEEKKPATVIQKKMAEKLNLPFGTVRNYFMNSRRKMMCC